MPILQFLYDLIPETSIVAAMVVAIGIALRHARRRKMIRRAERMLW